MSLLEARIFTFYKQLLGVSHDAMRVNELKALRKEHETTLLKYSVQNARDDDIAFSFGGSLSLDYCR